jgi:MoaA/NifB/PqqE/SkfB family radical SAM enzyme
MMRSRAKSRSKVRRLLNAVANKLERGRRERMFSGPVEAIVHVSDRCSFRCAMCMNADRDVTWPVEGRHEGSGDFTAAMFDDLLACYPSLRTVCFAGVGEPLLVADLEQMVRSAHASGLRTTLVTNGTHLSDNVAWMSSGVLDSVSVSVNAWDAETMTRYCRVSADAFVRVRDGIEALVTSARREGGTPRIEMSAVLWRSRRDDAASVLSYAERLGVTEVTFHNLIPSSLPGCGLDEVLTRDDATWLIGLRETGRHAGIHVHLPLVVDLEAEPARCVSSWRVLYVDAAGGVSGCFRVEAPSVRNGDWRDASTWNGVYYRESRRAHMSGGRTRELPDRCRTCPETRGRSCD